MTKQELERIESILKENGYKRSGEFADVEQGDYYWWKSFGKDDNPYEEYRSLWIIRLNVYEWFKFWERDTFLKKHNKYASFTATFQVSRVVSEVRKEFNYDLRDDEFDLNDIENKAYAFYQYVNDYFKLDSNER